MKMTLPCGAFGKFGSFLKYDVDEVYTSSIPNESRCPSFEMVFLVQKADLHRIRDSVVQKRAPVRSILKFLKKVALPCGAS